jgi:Transglutaminase-like superfamily
MSKGHSLEVVQIPTEPPTVDERSNRHRVFRAAWYAQNVFLILSILVCAYSGVWEYSTRRFLKGFSDAVVPEPAPAQEKVEAILNWMAHGPARREGGPVLTSPDRNPTDTLNYASLLKICGSATNAFINLAESAGLPTRRLLLLDSRWMTNHVVAEALVDGRWIVVDPAFRTVLRGATGQLLTREELVNPAVRAAATKGIKGYSPEYTFDRTAHVRWARLGFVGLPLQRVLDWLLPDWEDSTAVSLLLERESLAMMLFMVVLVAFLTLLRIWLRWYGENRLGFRCVRFRKQLRQGLRAFFDAPS